MAGAAELPVVVLGQPGGPKDTQRHRACQWQAWRDVPAALGRLPGCQCSPLGRVGQRVPDGRLALPMASGQAAMDRVW